MFSSIIATVLSLVTAHAGTTFLAGAVSAAGISLSGNVLNWILGLSWVQKLLGQSLNWWKGIGITAAMMLQAGPLKNFFSLIVLPIVYIGFGVLSALDAFLEKLPPDVQSFVTPFVNGLAASGSKDRFTYVTAKLTPAAPTPAITVAAAQASPTGALPAGPVASEAIQAAADSISAELKS